MQKQANILKYLLGGLGIGGAGYGVGRYTGYNKGYSTGSNEGGTVALQNLYKGLYDLMQRGANSKTDLKQILKLDNNLPGASTLATPLKQANVKLAQHVIRLSRLQQELQTYDVAGLQKAAATGYAHEARLKYAALKLAQLKEKQAFLKRAGLGGLLGKGLDLAARGLLYHAPKQAWKGFAATAKAFPKATAVGTGAAGLAALPAAQQLNNRVIQPMHRSMQQNPVYNRLSNAGNALVGNAQSSTPRSPLGQLTMNHPGFAGVVQPPVGY